MTILAFVLMLVVIGVVFYGIKLALAGSWRELLWLALGLIAVIWILSALGVSLPTIPTLR